ncbi:MAG: FecR domain-containing protein [Cytophaga sp.]|nr:FecR domain-containing protein [Undibacterium sp.]
MNIKTIVFLVLLCLARTAFAQVVATITHLSGVLTVKHLDGSSKLLSVKSEVQQGDILITERDTYVRLKFADASEIVLRPDSQLKVEKFNYEIAKPESDSLVLNMIKGGMRAVTGLIGKRNKAAVSYTTPTATIGIRGTHFGALLCQGDCEGISTANGMSSADGLYLDVAQGAIFVTNGAGNVLINVGEFGFVRDRVTLPVVIPSQQGIQVTMPSGISHNKAGGEGGKARSENDAQCVAH